jgi:hypothetical protein
MISINATAKHRLRQTGKDDEERDLENVVAQPRDAPTPAADTPGRAPHSHADGLRMDSG